MVAITQQGQAARFACRGAVGRLFTEWHQHEEVLLDGPAGTGKTLGIAHFWNWFWYAFPGCRLIFIRKTMRSLRDSVQQKLEDEVWGPNHYCLQRGGSRRQRSSYINEYGSEIVLCGMNEPLALYSAQYDGAWVNEGVELNLDQYESITRALRNTAAPHNPLISDTNPGPKNHWFNRRCDDGLTERFLSRHVDNPWITDTEAGRKYLRKLKYQLTGLRKERLYHGRWVVASGAVYPNYREHIHCFTGDLKKVGGRWLLKVTDGMGASYGSPKEVWIERFCTSFDWGWSNPSVLQLWGFDKDMRMYLLEEGFHTHWTRDQWMAHQVRLNQRYNLFKMVVDSAEPDMVATLNQMLSSRRRKGDDPKAIVCQKRKNATGAEQSNLDMVRNRMDVKADGLPSIFFRRDSLWHPPDPDLMESSEPWCTMEEIPDYIFKEVEDDAPSYKQREEPVDKHDDGCDAMQYMVRFVEGRNLIREAPPRSVEPGSIQDILKLHEVFDVRS